MNAAEKSLERKIESIVDEHRHKVGALLPILHAVQEEFGHIPFDSIPVMARLLGLSRAEIQGVMGFYHDFRSEPAGNHLVQICRAEACQAMGGRQLEEHVSKRLGVDYGQTTSNGKFTLEPVYCLGNCACSPSIRINNDVFARVTEQSFDTLIDELEAAD